MAFRSFSRRGSAIALTLLVTRLKPVARFLEFRDGKGLRAGLGRSLLERHQSVDDLSDERLDRDARRIFRCGRDYRARVHGQARNAQEDDTPASLLLNRR